MAHVYQMPPVPGVEDFYTLVAFLANTERYAKQMDEMLLLRDEINKLVEKVGKAEEIDSLHMRAVADRQEGEAVLLRARESAASVIAASRDTADQISLDGAKELDVKHAELSVRQSALKEQEKTVSDWRAKKVEAEEARAAADKERAALEEKRTELNKLKKVYEDKLEAIRKAAGE